MSKEEYIAKYKQLVEKISNALSQKFFSIFKEKAYDSNQLSSDLNKLCSDVDFNNLEFTLFFMDIERKVLAKVSKMPSISYKTIPDKNKIEYLTEPTRKEDVKPKIIKEEHKTIPEKQPSLQKESKVSKPPKESKKCDHVVVPRHNAETQKEIRNVILNDDEEAILQKAYKKEKVEKLKNKENDEWALIAKYNYYKNCVEKRNKLLAEKDKREGFTKTLQRQLSEKEMARHNLKLLEDKFVEEQKENFKKLDEKEKKEKENKTNKVQKEKEVREQVDKINKEQKKQKEKEEEENDKNVIENVKSMLKIEEEKKQEKKLKEKERFQEIMRENQMKIERKQKEKEEEKKYNQKCTEQYSKLLDKQDEERDRLRKSIKDKCVNQIDKVKEDKAKSTSEFLEKHENHQYLKEKEEIEKRQKSEEDKKEASKHKMIENMKMELDKQIEERKRKVDLEKQYNMKFTQEVVNKNVEHFNNEKKDSNIKTKEKIEKYRE